MNAFIAGALVMAYLVVALFFARFYRQTKESLFLFFSISFALLCASRVALTLLRVESEQVHYLYSFRLLAFVVLLVGIVRKNRGR
jgi:peptidoglycan/LPS O-acetylase OafA/YrhL